LIKPDFDKTTGNYLYLRLKGTDSSIITVGYGEKYTNSFSFSTEPTSTYENYLVRVSTQWEWMNSDIDKISITSNGDLELSEMNIRKGD
jgi:acid phosphatase class B